jgi:hypoxanthine phosphoribosyltransferase
MENTEKLEALLPDRHVIVVEDIVDTGLTLKILLPQLHNTCHPQTLNVCTLLEKRVPRPPQEEGEEGGAVVAKYSGFSIPNKFIIGFGLDFNDLYRDLKDIWVISELGVALGGKI